MSFTNHARRCELRFAFEGNIPDLSTHMLSGVSYTDEEEDAADDLQIEYDDRECNLLGNWLDIRPQSNTAEKEIKTTVTDEKTISYVVQRGDTLSAIALEYLGDKLAYNRIASENNIKNPDLIYPGQVLKITTGGEAQTTVTETPAEENESKIDTRKVSAVLVQKNWNDTGKDVLLNMGVFEIDSIDVSGPPTKATLKATSIPYTTTLRMEKKSKAWEKISLKAIGEEIASNCGLSLMYEASYNPMYKRKEQVQTSDIKFLMRLCHAAGMALKVTAMMIVIYDAAEYDNKPAIRTFTYGEGDIISYKLGTSLTDTAYTSCHVTYTDPDTKENIEYTYTPDTSEGTGQTLEVNEKVTSTEEAEILAKKRLREKNAQEFTASLKVVGDVSLVAGVTVKLKGFQIFDRKYKVTQAKHSLSSSGYTVDLSLKQVLEGY